MTPPPPLKSPTTTTTPPNPPPSLGYHVLTSTALRSKGVNALVFALYRELSASVLIAGLAALAVHRGGHSWRIERRHLPRFCAMVRSMEVPHHGGDGTATAGRQACTSSIQFNFIIRSTDRPSHPHRPPNPNLQGLFSAGNVLGAVQSLTLISATNFAVLQPSIPVFTMLLSVLFRMERLTWLKVRKRGWGC